MRCCGGSAGLIAALLAVAALWTIPVPAASAASAQLTISPEPGTPDASPNTQISILGIAPPRIRSVRVAGSVSGVHPGTLRNYSARRGASFVLRRPLTQGERVTVSIRFSGRPRVAFSFTVARLAPAPPILSSLVTQPSKLEHFVSEPGLLPPRITVNRGARAVRGDIFLTPLPSPTISPTNPDVISIRPVGPGGPMIIDGRGRLVWFHQVTPPDIAANFRPESFDRREVLTWWQGGVTAAAYGTGEGVIADTRYRILKAVRAGNGYSADLHEFVLTPSGDALFTVYSLVRVHLPGTAAGSLTRLLDGIVQEVDVRTGLVVWEWHALGHIPLADSYATPGLSAYNDVYHLNSIQWLGRGRVLVSARDTSAVYEIDRASGRVLWTLGGKASSFRLGPGARFWFQHDAQLLPGNRVSLFDDEGGPPFLGPARGLILRLDTRHHIARVARQYRRSNSTRATSEGSVQTLAGGKAFVDFGSAPFFSKFSSTGKLVFDASLPLDDATYRAFNFAWHATPTARPVVAVRRGAANRAWVYASWNGATMVARWQVLAGRSASKLRRVAAAPARGFETRIGVSSSASVFAVRALGARGRVLATSTPVAASS